MTNTTVQAYEVIASNKKEEVSSISKQTNHKIIMYVYTPADGRTHRYFHSLSIDKQVEDFMGTCELKCLYDSDYIKYWEPIRNYCVVYGSNHGTKNVKVLFVGRVREVRQEGYELVITLQDYGWKFKQMVSQSYANDNVIGKDGYTIMRLIFEALKIDSYVISPSARNRLKQVGIDSDGNVTLNKEKIEEMPDLIKRLQSSNPQIVMNKETIENKIKESELHNINHINYTLKYEKPTPVMKKISSNGSNDYAPGANVYNTSYRGQTGQASASSNTSKSSGGRTPPNWVCNTITSTSINKAMQSIWKYNRGYVNDYSWAKQTIANYARQYPTTGYRQQAVPCLNTLAQYCIRKDKINAAQEIRKYADKVALSSSIKPKTSSTVPRIMNNTLSKYQQVARNPVKYLTSWFGIK